MIASALQGSRVRIRLSDMIEQGHSQLLIFPRRVALATTSADQFKILLFRTLFAQGSIRQGIGARNSGGRSISEQFLAVGLAFHEVNADLSLRYPRFAELRDEVQGLLQEACLRFTRYDPAFANWSEFLTVVFSGDAAALKRELDVDRLLRVWNSEWMSLPYFPMHVWSLVGSDPSSDSGRDEEGIPDVRLGKGLATGRDVQKSLRIKTAFKVKRKELKAQAENPLTHVFEKVMTAEAYHGGSKTQDGSDEMEAHAQALSELTLETVAQSSEASSTILNSDIEMDTGIPEQDLRLTSEAEILHLYPEWFASRGEYKEDYCRVYERTVPNTTSAPPGLMPEEVRQSRILKQKLSAFLNELRWKPRQKEGQEIDLDAVIRWRSQAKFQGPVEQRLYLNRSVRERNLAVMILMDASLSTDGWSQNQRIIELMKSSLARMGGVFESLGDLFAIATFQSHSRRRCNFNWVKKWEEPWALGLARIASVEPEGYTRIGPALRHAGAVFATVRARRKLLVLLSDAKPTDYDRYEGMHGLKDVEKSVRELQGRGIFVKGISVAPEHRAEMVEMFGVGQYQVVTGASELSRALFSIFIELMNSR
jgi:nitric oxide reductase activation protein